MTKVLKYLLSIMFFVVLTLIFYFFLPVSIDWSHTYAKIPANISNIFAIRGFTNPPWIILFLPHAFLPLKIGNAINAALNVLMIFFVVQKVEGRKLGLVLAFTNPFFIDLLRTNNIDWIAMLAFLSPPIWGLPLLAVKPQAFGGIALLWAKRNIHKLWFFAPFLIVLIASFFVWPGWIFKLRGEVFDQAYNFAPWPLLIPIGIFLIWYALRNDDEIAAIAATPFLMPYIAPYSFAGILAALTGKHRRIAIIIYVVSWWYFVVESRRLSLF